MLGESIRSSGYFPGIYDPGPFNCITDVSGVKVGQLTLIEGDSVRTGVTAVLPHGENLFLDRVPAGVAVGNGFGKMVGVSQIQELGELETPVLLTSTLAVPRAMEAIIEWTMAQPGLQTVQSINAVVGETNDGYLNDSRRRPLTVEHMLAAIETAEAGQAVAEGAVGAGTGTVCFGWKGGIGTSSRRLPPESGGTMLGVLVQANYGGYLQVLGVPVGRLLRQESSKQDDEDGSIMILIATDAPLSDRNLRRLAWRAFAGLARTGSSLSNGSGDYALAFSTADSVRRPMNGRREAGQIEHLPNDLISPLFQAVIEATEEAIYNALFKATSMTGYLGRTIEALPVARVLKIIEDSPWLAENHKRV